MRFVCCCRLRRQIRCLRNSFWRSRVSKWLRNFDAWDSHPIIRWFVISELGCMYMCIYIYVYIGMHLRRQIRCFRNSLWRLRVSKWLRNFGVWDSPLNNYQMISYQRAGVYIYICVFIYVHIVSERDRKSESESGSERQSEIIKQHVIVWFFEYLSHDLDACNAVGLSLEPACGVPDISSSRDGVAVQ